MQELASLWLDFRLPGNIVSYPKINELKVRKRRGGEQAWDIRPTFLFSSLTFFAEQAVTLLGHQQRDADDRAEHCGNQAQDQKHEVPLSCALKSVNGEQRNRHVGHDHSERK